MSDIYDNNCGKVAGRQLSQDCFDTAYIIPLRARDFKWLFPASRLSIMVGLPAQDAEGPVQLLQEDDPGELVGEGEAGQGETQVSLGQYGR